MAKSKKVTTPPKPAIELSEPLLARTFGLQRIFSPTSLLGCRLIVN